MSFLSAETARALAELVGLDALHGDVSDDETDASPLERLRGIRSLVAALEADPASLAAVREALGAGRTWEEIADAAGLSASAAKYRWAGDDDEIAARHEASRKRKRERPSSVPTELPGLSVSDAAAKLGVTPQAIYQRVTRGLLRAETVELADGRKYKRVFLPEE
ncbi:DNA-directed RNA polymerase specialized sigma24 family protein [Agromyces hippuratus]|uniref:DNA-directed RNA polymerase specialized sigma24 family protein n=1 Tax=Agromyces hippuratus TaxID=286438 RepID=A0A852WYN8_9MICO|nr:hypothetical protein [Agromyces hippuratus]NYG22717.1 DNA-directed RNA polymerase specialized sigma24 family protein [Agromyces hippuratus]